MPRRYLDRRAEAEIEAMLARGELAQTKKDGQPADEQQAAPKSRSSRRAPGDWQGLVEQRIQDGMERGLFDNLRGMGQPLNLDEDQFVPDDMKMAFRMLRSTGLAPLWVELNKEIREDIARLERFRAHVHSREQLNPIEREHLREQYLARVQEINGKIMNYNIAAPSSQVHFGLLIVAEELAKFDQPPA
jgi:DnaJ homolog subfamily C member 28